MPRYKPAQRNGLFVPVVLEEQIIPGGFEHALVHLIEHELDLGELDERFRNDDTGASAYDPRAMLKLVLLAYSRGITSSRRMAAACEQNVLFMAVTGDARPSYTHIAKFVRELGPQVGALFTQVLMTCDRLGLIGREMFAIDGVKLPANASKQRSGTHAELAHRARRLEQAAQRMIDRHRASDEGGAAELPEAAQARIEALRREARRTRDFLATHGKRTNGKGSELKTNVTDPESAKMATGKGVIQGYAAQASVDSAHQIIVAADVIGSGSEQTMLLPMVEQSQPWARQDTLITADAGYHSEGNVNALAQAGIEALIADNQMRQRDERLAGQGRFKAGEVLWEKTPTGARKVIRLYTAADFEFASRTRATCPQGKTLSGTGTVYRIKNDERLQYKASARDCDACAMREHCMRRPEPGKARTVTRTVRREVNPDDPVQRMRARIDSEEGRCRYNRRIATVEPVFANIRHNKGLCRFSLRGRAKVNTQWHLYCLVHNIEKLRGRVG